MYSSKISPKSQAFWCENRTRSWFVQLPVHVMLRQLRHRCYHFLRLFSSSSSSSSSSQCQRPPQAIADLINTQSSFSTKSLPSLLSKLSPSSFLLTLPLLKDPLPIFNVALNHHLPLLDHRHVSMTLHLVLRHSHSNLTSAIQFLLSLRDYPSLLSDLPFNSLIRALSNAGRIRNAVTLFRLMPSFNVFPSAFTFNSLLVALFHRGQIQNAHNLFDEMPKWNVEPDVCTLNTMIRGYCLNGLVDEAFGLFSKMGRCQPDVLTYNTLLDGLCRVGKVDTARNFLDGMRRKGEDIAPNVVSYTTLIRGYCAGGEAEKAVGVLDMMVEVGVKPNKVTYNTIVKGLCEVKRMDLVKEVLERDDGMGGGFKPDTCTFNTLMAAHCSSGNVNDAIKVFDRMLELRVKTDSASYSTLIRGLCKNGEFERAEVLVDELLERRVLARRGVCVPLVAAYNPIFEHLCLNGKADKAGTLLKQLVERGASIDFAAFKTVILGYCREGEFKEGYKLVIAMVRRNLKPDLEIFDALIKGFLTKEDSNFALKSLERMLSCGHRPRTSTFHSVLVGLLKKDGLAEEAGNLIKIMVERKVRHSIDLSTDVVAGLFGVGLNDTAFEIVGLIYDNGYCVKMEKLVGSLCKGKKYLEARYLLLFSLKRNENLDARVYGTAISGLCATGKASEAFELFYGMTEKGSTCAISSCLTDLRNALETAGRLREAEFVSKQMNRLITRKV